MATAKLSDLDVVPSLSAICHPSLLVVNCVGLATTLVLALTWVLFARSRRRILTRSRARQRDDLVAADGRASAGAQGAEGAAAGVSVIMAVKGVRPGAAENWRSRMETLYDGPLEFVFVVEDARDPAYAEISSFLQREQAKVPVVAKVVTAGRTGNTSQKIHNMLAGVSASNPDCRYVLFLDDDTAVHPQSIQTLVGALEADASAGCAGGFLVDLPASPSASLASYCALVYRAMLFGAFVTDPVRFAWGGCLMLRRQVLLDPAVGIVDAWLDSGYSDDMIITSICHEKRRAIRCPPEALFVHQPPEDYSMWAHITFVMRQQFVLHTYANPYHCLINYGLLAVNFGYPLAIVVCLTLAAWQMAVLVHALVLSPQLTGEQLTSHDCWPTALTAWASSLALAIAVYALHIACDVVAQVCSQLSPHRTKISAKLSPFRAVAALVINSLVLVLGDIWVALVPSIVWANIRYKRWRGRVVEVEHLGVQ